MKVVFWLGATILNSTPGGATESGVCCARAARFSSGTVRQNSKAVWNFIGFLERTGARDVASRFWVARIR